MTSESANFLGVFKVSPSNLESVTLWGPHFYSVLWCFFIVYVCLYSYTFSFWYGELGVYPICKKMIRARPLWKVFWMDPVSETMTWSVWTQELGTSSSTFYFFYPLVNCYITMERSTIFNGKSPINSHFQPSGKHTKSYWKWWFLVSFPMKNGGSFHSYVNVYQRVTCFNHLMGGLDLIMIWLWFN